MVIWMNMSNFLPDATNLDVVNDNCVAKKKCNSTSGSPLVAAAGDTPAITKTNDNVHQESINDDISKVVGINEWFMPKCIMDDDNEELKKGEDFKKPSRYTESFEEKIQEENNEETHPLLFDQYNPRKREARKLQSSHNNSLIIKKTNNDANDHASVKNRECIQQPSSLPSKKDKSNKDNQRPYFERFPKSILRPLFIIPVVVLPLIWLVMEYRKSL